MHWPTTHSALVDLAGFYRDSLVSAWDAPVALTHPDAATTAAAQWTPESLLRRLHAVLVCREALELNVKPRIAVEAMTSALQRDQRPRCCRLAGHPRYGFATLTSLYRQRRLSSVGQSGSLVMSRSSVRFR